MILDAKQASPNEWLGNNKSKPVLRMRGGKANTENNNPRHCSDFPLPVLVQPLLSYGYIRQTCKLLYCLFRSCFTSQ